MSVTFADPVRLDDRTWRISWVSDLGGTPSFRIYRDGALVATTTATAWDFYVEAGDSFFVEVLDDADALPGEAVPGRITLQWFGVSCAATYRIEEYVDSAWTPRGYVTEAARGYYHWISRWLEDDTSHQFRVVPVGENGNDGTPLAFACLMVRRPDAPSVSVTYDDGTRIATISAS